MTEHMWNNVPVEETVPDGIEIRGKGMIALPHHWTINDLERVWRLMEFAGYEKCKPTGNAFIAFKLKEES